MSDQAFPSQHQEMIPSSSGGYPSGRIFSVDGLSKRELFAAMAMANFSGIDPVPLGSMSGWMNDIPEKIAQRSIQYADALIKELNKK